MPFFEPRPPLPDPEEARPTGWVPPLWDRPSEATLGAPVPLVELLATTDRLALVLGEVVAYPNGFTFTILIQGNPMAPRAPSRSGMLTGPGAMFRAPRVGFAFADGTLVREEYSTSLPKDERGIPTVAILRSQGGGGSDRRYELRYWCFPLPPPGAMDLYVEWADFDVPETKVMLDADAIITAAGDAVVLWEPDE